MVFLGIGIALMIVLIGGGAGTDPRARRRGRRQRSDGRAVRDRRALVKSEPDVRTEGTMPGLSDAP
jgi:hypothetical protein